MIVYGVTTIDNFNKKCSLTSVSNCQYTLINSKKCYSDSIRHGRAHFAARRLKSQFIELTILWEVKTKLIFYLFRSFLYLFCVHANAFICYRNFSMKLLDMHGNPPPPGSAVANDRNMDVTKRRIFYEKDCFLSI